MINEGLVNQRLLKIQSDPRGNSWESSGDEMNLHLPQSLAATAELKELMAVSNNIVSAQANKPVIGIVQDSLLAAWKMTGKDIFLTREQVYNIVWNGKGRINNKKLPPPAILKPKKLWSGKQIFALLLPDSLYFNRKSSWCSPNNQKGFAFDDGEVIVKSGEIMSGQFCKKSLGASEGGVIHRLWLEYSPETAKNFISSLQFLVNYFIQNHGFSIGAGDTFIDKDAQALVRQSIDDNITKVKQILHVSKGNENKVLFEKKINQILNNAMAQSGKFVQDKMTTKNNIHATVTAGSKGSAINLSQIMACVGQQNVNGQRIIEGYTDRPLPHFEKNDQSPEARGFVKHSYLDGLEAHEFFYHAMGGREGVIDTAVKSVTGDTEIVVMENGKILDIKIGDWIDGYLDTHPDDIERDVSRPDFEFLRIDEKYDVFIPTGDEKGVVSWGRLTAVTRHDPTDVMYDIETCSGRRVTVADSESLLIWDGSAYIKKHSNMVKVGDCVPIVTHIPEPPQEVSHVDMKEYLPKTQYVYGSDFHKCVQLMREAQGDAMHIPRGWYERNNGNTFTLPYSSKARVQRATVRSNIDLKSGCVYPYHASRMHSHFPEKFELNYENGVFIGLYLADGCAHDASGTVSITKQDSGVQQFVEKWFDSYSITHRVDVSENSHGRSESVIGSSTLLVRFLNAFVGTKASGKHVPSVAHAAPLSFVKGILNGYISGDGCIEDGGVVTSSASKALTEGISLLCARIGVFGKISVKQLKTNNMATKLIQPSYVLSIRAQWGIMLANTLELIHDKKRDKLKHISFTTSHRNYDPINETVKDRIVKITKRVGENKMYDVTVPSTLNFVIKNGMNVRDTSDTGYTQRRLVKAMEDLMVEHDLSMRNSSRDIVQFTYGDDGYDGAMLITQNVYDDIPSLHACAAEKAFKRTTSLTSVKSPMLIDILCDKFKSSHTSLTHEDVYRKVHRLVEEIQPMSPVIRDQMYTGMSSKRIVDEYKIQPGDFDEMLDTVYHQHNKAKVSKGDMTGIIAAQSMGEVVTQLCLNTFHSAGISAKNVTLGVPRFKELINVAKQIKSPMMTLPLRDEYTSYENIDFIAQKLEYVNIGCLISRKYMSGKRMPFTQAYLQLPFEQAVPEYYEKSIVFHFDMDALKRSGKTLYDIYNKLFKNYEDTLLPVYNHENDEPIMEILVVNEHDKNDIEIDDRYVFILMNKIMSKMTLDGDTEIKKTFVRRDEETDNWIIETDGLNLDFIFTLDYFKHDKCITNHVVYVYEHFGIEAARNVLLQEIKNVIDFDGGYVNRRHFYILVDTMTHKGDIMPITRHGINKANTGPLMKCSFEETMDILTDAGMFSEKDNLNGVTENIIMGKLAPIGSGSCGVMFNALTMDAINEEQPFEPESPEPSDGQYTDAYFDESIIGGMEKMKLDDDGSMCTDTWFNDTHSVTTETYFPIEGH